MEVKKGAAVNRDSALKQKPAMLQSKAEVGLLLIFSDKASANFCWPNFKPSCQRGGARRLLKNFSQELNLLAEKMDLQDMAQGS